MVKEDRRRYFVFASVILDIVTPLFQDMIEKYYATIKITTLQDFMESQNVVHTLFHLRHRNGRCCKDIGNCENKNSLPLIPLQWKKLYSEIPRPGIHNCHCKFTANTVQLNDLDISLSSLILKNCNKLSQLEEEAVNLLRRYKNDYLSHNTTGCITYSEYYTLWPDLVTYILRLDPSKQADIDRVEKRPLDDSLCKEYFLHLLDLHQQLDEIKSTLQDADSFVQEVSSSIHGLNSLVKTSVQGIDTKVDGIGISIQEIETSVQQTNKLFTDFLQNGLTCECGRQMIIPAYKDQSGRHRKQYKVGQDIFYLHQQINLRSLSNEDEGKLITDIKMMDDGRLVLCVPDQSKVLICNKDGSNVDNIPVRATPCCLTTVNSSTVAIVVVKPFRSSYIEMYDINYKNKLKWIQVAGIKSACGISTINNKLVVGGLRTLMIVDHQGEETIQKIKIRCTPEAIHASDNKIFFQKPPHRVHIQRNEEAKVVQFFRKERTRQDFTIRSILDNISTRW